MLFISRQKRLAIGDVQYSKYISEHIDSLFDCGLKPSQICLCTDKCHAYSDLKIAYSKKVSFMIDGVKYPIIYNAFDRAIFSYHIAETTEQQNESFERAKICVLNIYPLKISEQELEKRIRSLGSCSLKSQRLFNELMKGIREHEELVKNYHQYIAHPGVIIDERALSEVDDLGAIGYINFLANPTGGSKTETMKKLFHHESVLNHASTWINGSRALTQSFSDKNDSRHYDIQFKQGDDTSSVYGVALKILLNKQYELQRKRTQSLFIDEIENVFDLLTSDLVAKGSLTGRKTALKNIKLLFKQAKFVVVADAFPTKHTIETLTDWAKASNKKLRIFTHNNVKTKPKIRVLEYGQHYEFIKEKLDNRERVFAFCDASHVAKPSTFDAEYNGLRKGRDKKTCLKIDADFSKSEDANLLNNPNVLVDRYQLIFANAAIANGLSITHSDFKHASLLLNGTNLPAEVCQAKHRIRNVATVSLSFNKKHYFNDVNTNNQSILALLVVKALAGDFTTELFNSAMQSSELNWIAERIAFKNESRKHYSFTLLTMLKQQGHEIKFDDSYSYKNSNGLKSLIKEGTDRFIFSIVVADAICDAEAVRMSKKRRLTEAEQAKLTSYRIKQDFGMQSVSYELAEKYVRYNWFKVINNYRQAFAPAEMDTPPKQLQSEILKKTLTMALENGGYCSNSTTLRIMDFRSKGTVDMDGDQMKVKVHFDALMPLKNKNSYHISTIEYMLQRHFAIILDKTDTKRTRKPKDMIWRKAKVDETLVNALEHLELFKPIADLLNSEFSQ